MLDTNRSFAVIGLGAFGGTVASELTRFGNHVLGIDMDERRVAQLADTLAEARIADGTDEAVLREIGLDQYDVVVIAMGRDLQASVLSTMNATVMGVKQVWVKAHSKVHHRILLRLGADRVIQPEHEIGQHIAQMLHNPAVRDYVSLGNGFHVVNIVIPSKLDGRPATVLRMTEDYALRPLGLMRGADYLACDAPDLVLRKDDKLLVLGRRPDLRRFGDSL
ncbi:MAG TPA: TrkA family potassium uptake protein [Paracoccus sp.]|nr:TrkA family potassium uptake protein [Paracoccus sp. (in: a-proteobacteria)]